MENHELRDQVAVSPPPGKALPPVKSATRTLDIIEELAAAPNGLTFSALARQQAIPRSSLHALLAVLTERGYVSYHPASRTYALGIRTWEIGQAWRASRDLITTALPHMHHAVSVINETVQLAVLDGVENVYLAKVDCTHPLRLQSEVGKRLYAHATGLGKALLAALPEDELQQRYDAMPFPLVPGAPIQDLPSLQSTLATVRELGFAVDDQEYTPGLRCVAVPIHDADQQVIAALSAAIPLTRASDQQLQVALRAIAAASIDIARSLGASRPDPHLTTLTTWQERVLPPSSTHVTGGDRSSPGSR